MKIIENRKKFFLISFAIIAIGVIFMIINSANGKGALNYDVEFTGGTTMLIDMGDEYDISEVASIVTEVTGQANPQIQAVIGNNQIVIKIQVIDSATRLALMQKMEEEFGISYDALLESSDISATISSEIQKNAVIALLIACSLMLVYITIRFKDYMAGISAILALLHDVMVVVSAYALLRIPVNSAFVAAVLTILGYSINATIVIFDRIRENKAEYKRLNQMAELIDKSVSQTLARSINTSLTTLLAIACVYIFGVDSIREFALPIMIGIIGGTYSSVFLSGSIWYEMKQRLKSN